MTIQERIDSGQILSSLKRGYKESNKNELVNDFPFLSESLENLFLYARYDKIGILKDTNKERFYIICLFTDRHYYTIYISDNYLGCGLSNRYYEPFEDWTRGRDLPDGKCNIDTWNRILCAIIGCELIRFD